MVSLRRSKVSESIELFKITDSRIQHEQFVTLAINDYEELKRQIRNYFKQGMEEELREYKINIFSEGACNEEYYNIATN